MKRTLAAAALMSIMITAGCSQAPAGEAPAAGEAEAAAAEVAASPTAGSAAVASAAAPAVPGAPAFAVIYPGGSVEGPVTMAQGPAGPGGILTFTTDASPQTVAAFYRERAEASGLTTIASLNQPGTSAYSAGDGADGRGQLLSVVATPVEGGPTSVQLSWTVGR